MARRIPTRQLTQMALRIADALRPEKVILFGSHAYGRPTADSDVDVLVILNTRKPWPQRYAMVSNLFRPRPFPLDIVVRTPAEIKRALRNGDPFVREILERGRVLYER